MSQIIMKPVITEKMTKISEKMNRFGFIVDRKANKIQIRNAIEKLYSVNVDRVWTINYASKDKIKYTKKAIIKGSTTAYKKAIVSLAEGETIDLYSNI